MKKVGFVVSLTLLIILLSATEPPAETDQRIEIHSETGYCYIRVNWQLIGIQSYDLLELKVRNRAKMELETIDVSNKKDYLLDSYFLLDDKGEFLPVSFWLVATITPISAKYNPFATEKEFLASDIITIAPLSYPRPDSAFFWDAKVYIDFQIRDAELQKSFYGFSIDDKVYQTKIDNYNRYCISYQSKKPATIAAVFLSKENKKMKSPQIQIIKTENVIYNSTSATSKDLLEFQTSGSASEDLELNFIENNNLNSIKIKWNTIPDADHYFLYRFPAKDSLYCTIRPPANCKKVVLETPYHAFDFWDKSELKSGNVYTFWVTAAQGDEIRQISNRVSVYYFHSDKVNLTQKLSEAEVKLAYPSDYKRISSQNYAANLALKNLSYQDMVTGFVVGDSLSFQYHYFELKPYKILLSGNDGYLKTEEVIRAFQPTKMGNDPNLLAVMEIANFNPSSSIKIIDKGRIMTENPIRIPIPRQLISILPQKIPKSEEL
jgi:hypothetical protein